MLRGNLLQRDGEFACNDMDDDLVHILHVLVMLLAAAMGSAIYIVAHLLNYL